MNGVRNKIESWQSKLLSYGGKLILLNHVLSSLPIYFLSCLNPPLCVMHSLEKLFSDFFWGKSDFGKRHHWMSYAKMARPKKEGGIGVRRLCDITKAFSCKLAWRVLNKEGLWAKLMHEKYIKGGSFLVPQRQQGYSRIWKRVQDVAELVSSNAVVINKQRYWKGTTSGVFSTKSAWDMCRKKFLKWDLAKFVWHNYLPLKISVFGSMSLSNKIAVDVNIKKMGIHLASSCVCCVERQEETVDHLFVTGDLARHIWKALLCKFDLPMPSSLHWPDFYRSIVKHFPGLDIVSTLGKILPGIVAWFIWRARCKFLYDSVIINFTHIHHEILEMLRDIVLIAKPLVTPQKTHVLHIIRISNIQFKDSYFIMVRWIRPRFGFFKLNTDGACCGNPGESGGGGVIRDWYGNVRFGFSHYLGLNTNMGAEAIALTQGIRYLIAMEMLPAVIEIDSKVLVDMIHGKASHGWAIMRQIEETIQMIRVHNLSLTHVYREGNKAADFLAGLAIKSKHSNCFPVIPNNVVFTPLKGICCLDKSGCPSLRVFM